MIIMDVQHSLEFLKLIQDKSHFSRDCYYRIFVMLGQGEEALRIIRKMLDATDITDYRTESLTTE